MNNWKFYFDTELANILNFDLPKNEQTSEILTSSAN